MQDSIHALQSFQELFALFANSTLIGPPYYRVLFYRYIESTILHQTILEQYRYTIGRSYTLIARAAWLHKVIRNAGKRSCDSHVMSN